MFAERSKSFADIPVYDLSADHLAVLAKQTPKIPVVEGPLRPPTLGENSISYGAIRVKGTNLRDYQHARDYIAYGKYDLIPERDNVPNEVHVDKRVGIPHLRSVFLLLEDGRNEEGRAIVTPLHLTIADVGTSREYRNQDGEVAVDWSSRQARMTADKKGASPALNLLHELLHAYHDLCYTQDVWYVKHIRFMTPVDRKTNREEEVTMDHEDHAALVLNEGRRRVHGLLFNEQHYPVKHPMDTHTSRLFPIFAAMVVEDMFTRVRKIDEHLVGRSLGPGWNQYADEQVQRADRIDRKKIPRVLALSLKPQYFALLFATLVHDLQFLVRAE